MYFRLYKLLFKQESISMAKKPVKPAKQGDFSSQCGFYAIGNIVSLLFPKIKRTQIFDSIWDFYDETYDDANGLLYGIVRDRVNKILCHVIDEFDLPCSVYRPWWSKIAPNRDEFLNRIRDVVNPGDSAMILGYDYGIEGNTDFYSHWTVIRKTTGKSLLNFDSDDENSRISLQRCDLWSKEFSKERPYRLSSTDTFIISKTKKEKT